MAISKNKGDVMEELIGFGCIMLFIFYMAASLPWLIADGKGHTDIDAKVKTTEEWKEENMTNKEKVANWREEQRN